MSLSTNNFICNEPPIAGMLIDRTNFFVVGQIYKAELFDSLGLSGEDYEMIDSSDKKSPYPIRKYELELYFTEIKGANNV